MPARASRGESGLLDGGKAARGVERACAAVVVAEDDHAVERRARPPPRAQGFREFLGDGRPAVSEVAEDDQALGGEAVAERAEPPQRLLARAEGRRRARGAEGGGLAEVQVGDEQRARPRRSTPRARAGA